MNAFRFNMMQRMRRSGLPVLVAALLVTGAAWHGLAADTQRAATAAAVVSTPITHAIAGGRDSYADIVDVVSPGVVTVHAEGRVRISPTEFQLPDDDLFNQFFGNRERRPQGRPRQSALGSGVLVTTDGYVLTNNHVVDGADKISIDLTDGRTLSAKVIGTDKATDLALLKVNGSGFHPVALGNSDAVKVGDVVLAVGNPLNVGQTVTMGIISAKGRSTGVGDGSYEDFLQTDAPINHGNSGGALVNTKGELVGINSQILSNSDGNIGIGFAIPANMAKHVMEDLRTHGKVTRGHLGVSVQPMTSDLAQSLGLKDADGAIVSAVTPGSAAERAGVKRGDVIKAFNGQPVHDTNSLRNRIADAGPGATAELLVVRDGAERRLSVKLDEASPEKLARGAGDSDDRGADDKTALGVSVAPITPELADEMRIPKNAQGLVVENVSPDSRAAEAGIQPGDVIEEANRQPVKSVDELRMAARRAADKPLLLLINRKGNEVFVTVKPSNG